MSDTTTIHRLTLKDMRNDLDEFIKYSREFKDDDINVNIFVHHMHFLYDELEKLSRRIEVIEDARSFKILGDDW